MIKLLIGGSPCTHWSIAQTKDRETKPEGLGWELFLNYRIARDKYKPDYFLYENNKSMSADIRAQITKELGVEPVLINSALVSAQNRQRLYWVGKREPDGTYSQVDVALPEDRGILLRDILDSGFEIREKAYTLKANYSKASQINGVSGRHFPAPMAAEMVCVGEMPGHNGVYRNGKQASQQYRVFSVDGKSVCLDSDSRKLVSVPVRVGDMPNSDGYVLGGQAHRVYSADGKSPTLTARPNGGGVDGPLASYPMPCAGRMVGRRINDDGHRDDYNDALERVQRLEINDEPQKTNCLTTVQKDNVVAVPAGMAWRGRESDSSYEVRGDQKSNALASTGHQSRLVVDEAATMRVQEATKQGYVDIRPGECVDLAMEHSKTRRGRRMAEKSNCLTTTCALYEYLGAMDKVVCEPLAKTMQKAIQEIVDKYGYLPEHFNPYNRAELTEKSPTLSTGSMVTSSCATVLVEQPHRGGIHAYQVKDGQITIKGKQYPIKLRDGCYVIRKLTVPECMRLQTVPEWYVFPVSDTQAYKMLGNGWTVDVIRHILNHMPGVPGGEVDVLSMYDGMACGMIALVGVGARVMRYRATETDKFCIRTVAANFPAVRQLGDAFQVREWEDDHG